MTKFQSILGFAATAFLLAGCSGAALQPGTSITFEPPIEQPCSDEPIASPLPFMPDSLVGFSRGAVFASIRYTVQPDGSVEDAVISSIALGEGARPMSQSQLEAIRDETPDQVEAEWRHAPGDLRICERPLGWLTFSASQRGYD